MAILGKRRQNAQPEPRVLDVTASMQGSLTFREPVALKISGRFEGTLETQGDLTIGEQAVVQADITGESITIAGRATGKITAKQSLTLKSTAVLMGDVSTPVLEIEQGARMEGSVRMAQQGIWMKGEEVAEYLEVELRLVEQWAREGRIPAVQKDGLWRFERMKIDEWVAAQKSS